MLSSIKNNITVMRLLLKFCPQHVFISFFMAVFSSVISILSVLLTQKILDLLGAGYSVMYVLTYVIIAIIINALYYTMSQVNLAYITPKNSIKLRYNLLMLLYTESSSVEFQKFDDPRFYDNLSLAITQSETRSIAVLSTFTTLVTALFSVGALFALLGQATPELILICCVATCINLITQIQSSKNRHCILLEQTTVQRELSYVQRMFLSRNVGKEIRSKVYVFALLTHYFTVFLDHLQTLSLKYAKKLFYFGIMPKLLDLFVKWGIIFLLTVRFLNGNISLGEFVSLNSASGMLFAQLNSVLSNCASLYTNGICTSDFLDFIGATTGNHKEGILLPKQIEFNIKELTFRYNNSQENTLEINDLSIKSGEKLVICGENGSGKSTLIKLLGRLYSPTCGSITIDGHSLSDYSFDSYFQDIAIVWQNSELFAVSIAENILLKPFPHTEEETASIMRSLAIVNLYDKVQLLPEGINTALTKEFDSNGAILSGGELKKIALARVFVRPRKVIILDEPWNSLDSESIDVISNHIFNHNNTSTVIMVTHNQNFLRRADRVICVKNGKVIQIEKEGVDC